MNLSPLRIFTGGTIPIIVDCPFPERCPALQHEQYSAEHLECELKVRSMRRECDPRARIKIPWRPPFASTASIIPSFSALRVDGDVRTFIDDLGRNGNPSGNLRVQVRKDDAWVDAAVVFRLEMLGTDRIRLGDVEIHKNFRGRGLGRRALVDLADRLPGRYMFVDAVDPYPWAYNFWAAMEDAELVEFHGRADLQRLLAHPANPNRGETRAPW